MWLYPVIAIAIMIVAFIALGVRCFIFAITPGLPRNTKRLTLALGWVCVVFIAMSLQGAAQQAVERGWLDESVRDWLFTWGSSILATFALSIAALSLWLITTVITSVLRDEQLVSVMLTSPNVALKASDLKLTARELDVLETMAEGHLSDDEIATDLFISPATAATHVRNILRKADVNNRRDLVLLYAAGRGGNRANPAP